MEAEPETVDFRGGKVRIDWLKKYTQLKFSHIVLKEDNPDKRNAKLCACILNNGIFAWFKPAAYALRWRWYYYVIDLNATDALKVIYAAKKKIQSYQSEFITIFSTEMKNEMMAMSMTREEARAIQAGQHGGEPSR